MQNISRSLLTITALTALMLFQQASFAQERWYQVEVIVVEHKDQSGITQEAWPKAPGVPQTSYAQTLQALIQNPDHLALTEFATLNNNELELNEDEQSLIKRTGSRVILHTGWRQKLEPNEKTPVRITGGDSYRFSNAPSVNELDGTLTFSRSRYLHVKSDLILYMPVTVLDSTNGQALTQKVQPLAASQNWQPGGNSQLQGFRLQASEKLKKDEVLYLDHPAYGVLIKISDAKAPKVES